ncbi:hypothetical protein [Streptomyces broussonetiae]|uniref:Uncharacterized protein n=1 Tax=Streptomyces broussonetiae TaxID=2686304 RepID=A0ABV5EJ38_9ACTN
MNKTKGFSLVGILVIVAAVVVLGIVAWRVWDAGQNKQSDSTNANHQANNQSQNNEPEPEPATEVDPNEGYVVIEEWGVRFKPVEGLGGVEQFKPNDVTTDSISLTTKQLAEVEPSCGTTSNSMVLGLLTRSTETVAGHGGIVATVGDYKYQYRVSGAACSKDPANYSLESSTGSRIMESLKSLEAAK